MARICLQHAALVLHRRRPAVAEEQRHIHADQPGTERVLIHQRHLQARPGGFERGGEARFARADHQQFGLFGRHRVLLADRMKVGDRRFIFHQTASRAWARSAMRSSLFSMPTDTRIVAGPMPNLGAGGFGHGVMRGGRRVADERLRAAKAHRETQ